MLGLSALFPPAPKWNIDQVPDLTGRIAIVTGGNSGIGYETVRVLLSKNAKVYLAARSEERAQQAITDLSKLQLPGQVEWMQLDLASLESIKKFAEEYLAKVQRVDMLFNSAGVMNPVVGPTTKDGYELHVGTNSLGHHYLTLLLLPALRASAQATPDQPPRVCFTSSIAHRNSSPKGFDPTDVTGIHTSCYVPAHTRAYGQSKLYNILSANWFHRHYGKENIVFTSCHPGILESELVRDWNKGLNAVAIPLLKSTIFYPAHMGAITQLYLNTAPEAAGEGGNYYVAWARKYKSIPISRNECVQDAFAAWVNEQVTQHVS